MFDSGQQTDTKYLNRWANLYSLLQTIPRDRRFNMDVWGRQAKTECGTAACAYGHAALHPWFRRRGIDAVFSSTMLTPKNLSIFWGTTGFSGINTPFLPSTCYYFLLNTHYNDFVNLTPKRVARVVKAYMEHHWPKDKVAKAIDGAVATYDVKWVHKYTPWNTCNV